jgi:hypothetical protein
MKTVNLGLERGTAMREIVATRRLVPGSSLPSNYPGLTKRIIR